MAPRKTNAGLSAATYLPAESHFHCTSGETTSAFWRVLYLVAIKMGSLRCVHTLTPSTQEAEARGGPASMVYRANSRPGKAT